MRSALADTYDLERELGAGGMAIVFLARDLKHDREVALKVFRPELASSIGTERFLREIQIAAKLSHPHILPLYDSGEAAGFLYYIMPLVEGESLADLMEREKMLPFQDALQIAREVADALNYAHARGLVHRDIKPDNIMLSGGHAVVMDFGIARALTAAGGDKLTQTGMAVGTPLYMSPEQGLAVENVDGRTDIYALGCVLYEMLTGAPPFTGPTPQAVMARHTMDQVPSPATIRDTISPELEEIIFCALAKSPADRFRTAAEFGEAVKVIQTGTGTMPRMSVSMARPSRVTRTTLTTPLPFSPRRMTKPQRLGAASVAALVIGLAVYQFGFRNSASAPVSTGPAASSIAVLYFEDLSPNSELGHVADGVTEGLINQLMTVRGLDIVSRNGVAQFRETDVSPDSVARALNVGSVIRGSVEQTGDNLRVTVRLVDGTSGADLERTSFQVPAGELLAVRDSVALRASRLLRQRLGEEIRLRQRRAETASVEAWALVQRAERLRKDAEGLLREGRLEEAARDFQGADSVLALAEAADRDWIEPVGLRAHIAFRRSRTAQYAGDMSTTTEQVEVGLDHADRALQRAPNHARALEQRGTLKYWHWLLGVTPNPAEADRLLREAQQDLEAAVRTDATLATAHSLLSHLYINTGDDVAMLLAARQAYEEDAYLADANQVLSRMFFGYYNLGQLTEAQYWCEEGARRFPNQYLFLECQLRMMVTEQGDPDVDRAWQLAAQLEAQTPEDRREYWRRVGEMFVGGVIGRTGDLDSARAVLVRARGNREIDPNNELAEFEAAMRTTLGDYDEAVELLKVFMTANPRAVLEVGENIPWYWEPLADHPGFQALLPSRR
jgi:serine/threonine-protein kinase